MCRSVVLLFLTLLAPSDVEKYFPRSWIAGWTNGQLPCIPASTFSLVPFHSQWVGLTPTRCVSSSTPVSSVALFFPCYASHLFFFDLPFVQHLEQSESGGCLEQEQHGDPRSGGGFLCANPHTKVVGAPILHPPRATVRLQRGSPPVSNRGETAGDGKTDPNSKGTGMAPPEGGAPDPLRIERRSTKTEGTNSGRRTEEATRPVEVPRPGDFDPPGCFSPSLTVSIPRRGGDLPQIRPGPRGTGL